MSDRDPDPVLDTATVAAIAIAVVLAGGIAGLFIVDLGSAAPDPVDFDETVSVGLTLEDEMRLEDDDDSVVLPRTQVFYLFRTGDREVLLGTRIDYAEDVVEGRDPHLADFDAIQVWARRKLGDENAAGPVWRNIAKYGTNPNDFVGRAIENAVRDFRR